MEKSIVSQPTIAYRGINCTSPECQDFFFGLETGAEFQDKGYVSTTMNPNKFRAAKVRIKMIIPSGKQGAYLNGLSEYEGEAEILLPRNSRFKILSKTEKGEPENA